jgi:uncharacterized RDD family membrane protein YckC
MNKPASPIIRTLAAMTDLAIYLIIWLTLLIWLLSQQSVNLLMDTILTILAFSLVIPIATQIIQAYLTAKLGGSIGKQIWGLSVTDDSGKYISLKMAFFRTFIGPIISGPLCWFGYIWILVDKIDHRGWHDLACGTKVVCTKNRGTITGTAVLFIIGAYVGFLLYKSGELFSQNQPLYSVIITDLITELNQQLQQIK